VSVRTFVVQREHGGARIDRYLAEAFARGGESVTRTEIQRWIEHEHVRVNARGVKPSDKVRAGEVIEVEPEGPRVTSATPDADVPFEILHVDDAVVVVNKPPGVVVHPARRHESGTLVNGLLARGLFDASAIADDGGQSGEGAYVRPGVVHRLDKGTSGVMVVARTSVARERLKAQFQSHTIGREYVAIVLGRAEERTIATLHGRHPVDRMRFTSRVKLGKRAVTRIRVIERFGDAATFVACTLETGRTHQIRMHLAESGTPVLGDALYGKPPKVASLRAIGETLGHQALHARLLAFEHPTSGERVTFEVAPPEDFGRALEALRGRE